MRKEVKNGVISPAAACDAQEIFALYHSLIDMPYSTWSEDYPTMDIVREDLTEHEVLAMREADGRMIAAIAIHAEQEFADAAPWYPDCTRWVMLSRLGVARDRQGRGIAKEMLIAAMEHAREKGFEAVQFLVASSNPIAQRAYASLGFDVIAEVELWEEGEFWLCYQKRLKP